MLGSGRTNYYHVMSRVVDKRFIFNQQEKEFFLRTMRRMEKFSGVRILSYCIMSNHFHLLIEVPEVLNVEDRILMERLRAFYPKTRMRAITEEFDRAREHTRRTGSSAWEDQLRERYIRRMGDLSVFVKELKERFSKWYNRKEERRGTLWEERFKSVLIEGSTRALTTVAAYIELNPVRAGLVTDPRDYRFCSYAEAVAGGRAARAGLAALTGIPADAVSWRRTGVLYRRLLFAEGIDSAECKRGVETANLREAVDLEEALTIPELLRCRVRYFSDGVAVGSRLFVEQVFRENRRAFGARRKTGARKMIGGDWNGLFNLRSLSNALSTPG